MDLAVKRPMSTAGKDARCPPTAPTGAAPHRRRAARTVPRTVPWTLRRRMGQATEAMAHRASPAGPPGRVSRTPGTRTVATAAPQVAIVMIDRGVVQAMVGQGRRTAGPARTGGRAHETERRRVGVPIASRVDRVRTGGRIRETPAGGVRTCVAPRRAGARPPVRLLIGRARTAAVAAHLRGSRRTARSVLGSRGHRPGAIPPAGLVDPPRMAAVPSVGPLTGRTAGLPAMDAATTGPAAERTTPRRLRVPTMPVICAAPTGPTGSVRPRSTRTSRVMSSIVLPAPRFGTSRSGARSGCPSTS